MKQKIVINVQINCPKCWTLALKTAAKVEGVTSVGLEGENKDKVVVIGDGFDPVKLTAKLRKELRRADIISLTAVDKK